MTELLVGVACGCVSELSEYSDITILKLQELARQCMARDPEARPTFPQIQDRLEQLDRELHAAAQRT